RRRLPPRPSSPTRPPRSSPSSAWPSVSSSPSCGPGRRMRAMPDRGLLAALSVLAGLVDAMGFLALDRVFTAHVTGNLVVMAVQIATGGPPHVAQLLSVPIFAAAALVAYLLARRPRGGDMLLVGQAALLVFVVGPAAERHEILAASLAV